MSNILETLRELWSDVDEKLNAYRDEARELRERPSQAGVSDSIVTLHERLVECRNAQDRVEALIGELGLVRARLRKLVTDLEWAYDDKWRETMLSHRTGEYASAKAQDATYQAGALQELVNLRRAKRMLADVEEVYDFCNLKFRGLDSTRRDTETRIRILSLESHLTR